MTGVHKDTPEGKKITRRMDHIDKAKNKAKARGTYSVTSPDQHLMDRGGKRYNMNERIEELLDEAAKKPAKKEKKEYKKGMIVIPKVGPHAGLKHRIIHMHDDGAMNIVPCAIEPSKVLYRLGAAKCTEKQLQDS